MDEHDMAEIQILIEAIRDRYGYDFRSYAPEMVMRRVLQRLTLSGLDSISELRHKAIVEPDFADLLLKDFSINVTAMFRDPVFYRSFREKVVPALRELPFLKIWHAGSATGEEVYSMAILLKEEGLLDRVKIYATDFNKEVIQKAREGIFPLTRMREYIANYQKAGGREVFAEYYTARYEGAIMDQTLKTNIVFANHNLVSDEVFGDMQLIICRNVFIYFNRELQNRVLNKFRQSLDSGGFLCLGSKESLAFYDQSDCFEVISGKNRIYKYSSTGKSPEERIPENQHEQP